MAVEEQRARDMQIQYRGEKERGKKDNNSKTENTSRPSSTPDQRSLNRSATTSPLTQSKITLLWLCAQQEKRRLGCSFSDRVSACLD